MQGKRFSPFLDGVRGEGGKLLEELGILQVQSYVWGEGGKLLEE